MDESVEQLVRDLVDAWNAHDVERVAAFYAPDYEGVDVAQPGPQLGLEGVRQMLTRYVAAFPDLRFSADQVIVQDGRAALVWTAYGTHQGRLMGIPGTGRSVKVRGTSILAVERGRVKHALYIWDVAGLLRTLKLLPEL